MADDVLALIWEGAWLAGNGDALNSPRDFDALRAIYETCAPELTGL